MPNKILIVEKNQAFHDLYKAMLEDRNYEIISAYDWTEAKNKVEQKTPDLIISEVQLDGITGEMFFMYLKTTPEYTEVPVIIISSYSQKNFKDHIKNDPNFVYIDKYDLTEEKLLEMLDNELQ